jgi:hypothetical protein
MFGKSREIINIGEDRVAANKMEIRIAKFLDIQPLCSFAAA